GRWPAGSVRDRTLGLHALHRALLPLPARGVLQASSCRAIWVTRRAVALLHGLRVLAAACDWRRELRLFTRCAGWLAALSRNQDARLTTGRAPRVEYDVAPALGSCAG